MCICQSLGVPLWLKQRIHLQYRRHRRLGFDPWIRKTPGRGNGNPLYPCLKNSMDKGAWRATVYRVVKSLWDSTVRLSTHTYMLIPISQFILPPTPSHLVTINLFSTSGPYFCFFCCCYLVTKLCPALCDPVDCSPPGSSPDKNIGVGCHFLFQ